MATRKQGRSAINGRWTKVSTATKFPKTHVVETVKHKGKK